jgi:hypothetical protein
VTIEGLPDRIVARMQVQTRAAANAARASGGYGFQYFMFISKRWPDPATKAITVAFLGGDDNLRQQIATAAADWSAGSNVRFSFTEPATGRFREWTRQDQTYSADVRVAFDGLDGGGYWSLVGVDSSDPTLVSPQEASLELQGFASRLPSDWQATVRHEFGHALGLMHEHQLPVGGCDQDFKWDDDPGYVPSQNIYGQYVNDTQGRSPGIYTLLAGAPNYWTKEKVDTNMRQLAVDSQNYDYGAFDAHSIMKYYFDPRLFRTGAAAHCYSIENMTISDQDKIGIAKWYPPTASPALSILQQRQADLNKAMSEASKMQAVRSIQAIK